MYKYWLKIQIFEFLLNTPLTLTTMLFRYVLINEAKLIHDGIIRTWANIYITSAIEDISTHVYIFCSSQC